MAERSGGNSSPRIRSVPMRTMEHARSVHDVRHQVSIRHSTGNGDAFRQLERLARETERLERCLAIWVSQKERTEAQIAAVEREREQLLRTQEPVIRDEAERLEASAPIPFRRRRAG